MSQIKNKFIPNGEITLAKLNQSSATLGQLIRWNGSAWVPFTQNYSASVGSSPTTGSNTPVNVTALVSPTLPVGRYIWRVIAICQSTAANRGMGMRLGLGTAAVTALFGKWAISAAVDGTAKNFENDQLSATTDVFSSTSPAASIDFVVDGKGTVDISTAGTLNVQFRSQSSNSVTIQPGSLLLLEPI